MNKFWEVRRTAGNEIQVGQMRVTPEAQAVIILWPKEGTMGKFAMVWNRPLGVRVSAPSGQATAYRPIYDLTRLFQLIFYVLTIGFTLLGWKAGRRK